MPNTCPQCKMEFIPDDKNKDKCAICGFEISDTDPRPTKVKNYRFFGTLLKKIGWTALIIVSLTIVIGICKEFNGVILKYFSIGVASLCFGTYLIKVWKKKNPPSEFQTQPVIKRNEPGEHRFNANKNETKPLYVKEKAVDLQSQSKGYRPVTGNTDVSDHKKTADYSNRRYEQLSADFSEKLQRIKNRASSNIEGLRYK